MRNPSNFFDSMQDSQQEAKQHGKRVYQQKILRKLAPLYDYQVSTVRSVFTNVRNDEPLQELKHLVNNPELDLLFFENLTEQKMSWFIYRLDKTKAWKRYCEIHDHQELALFGMVFPMVGDGDWIMHNLGIKALPGIGRIMIPSIRADLRDIIVETLTSFID